MADKAALKLKRASERIAELNTLLREQRPFSYILQTDIITGDRFTRPERNEDVADEAAAIAGDAAHNIRSSLDHVYWSIVSPFAKTRREQRAVQSPFCEGPARLEEAVRSRLADRVSDRFFRAIMDLKPYSERGGNRLLYLIDFLDIPDKHQFLVPVADYTQITGDMMRRQIPDFPAGIGSMSFSQNRRGDVAWRSRNITPETLGEAIPPTTHMFKKKLDVPVEIVFSIGALDFHGPIVPTLNKLVDVARKSIGIMRDAA